MTPILMAEGGELEHIYLDGEDVIDRLTIDEGGDEPLAHNGVVELKEEPNNPILPETKEVIWGGIAFFLLVALLAKFAFPAVQKTMDDRTAKIQGDLTAAESAKDEAARLQREYEASLANAKAESNRIIEEARGQAEALRAERVGALDTELAQRRAAAMADIESAKAAATVSLHGQIASLAIGAAEKVVGQSLDVSTNTRIVEDYISQVARQ